jgi:ribonuclease HI
MGFWFGRPKQLIAYCDGGIGDQKTGAGAGVVIRDEAGEIIALVKRSLPPMTNNEAEYAALVLALEALKRYRPHRVRIYLDSEVVVGQMQGRFRINSAALRRWHSQACRLVRRFKSVTFEHIPRDANRLADALANEALTGEALPAKEG